MEPERIYYAVASSEGLYVDEHLGQAKCLKIYIQNQSGFEFVESREVPPPGTGQSRWIELAKKLQDCRSILVNGIGAPPLDILTSEGIEVVEIGGQIDQALEALVNHKDCEDLKSQRQPCSCHGGPYNGTCC